MNEFGCRLMIAAPQGVAAKLQNILSGAGIEADEICHSGADALGKKQEGTLILTAWRLPDMTGAQLAEEMGETCEVLMNVPQEWNETPGSNVMTLRNPVSQEAMVQSVRVLGHCFDRIHTLRLRSEKLARQLEERKIIERAKGRLMDTLKLSESDAHYRMQKMSMDTGRRIVDVAREILEKEDAG